MATRPPVPQNVAELVSLAQAGEQRDVEFKEAVSDLSARRKVVRAVAAMANLRTGGLVVLGVADKTRELKGLAPPELRLWSDRDSARSAVNANLEPAVDLQPHRVGDCVVLEVRPFSKTPVIVKRSIGASDAPDALVIGDLIYRSSAMTSSAPIASLEDWTELRETLILRAQAGANRLESDRRRAEMEVEEERVRELFNAMADSVVSHASDPKKPSLFDRLAGNLRSFQIRAQQSEAKANLKSAYTALRSYWYETERYPETLADAGFKPYPGGRYVYRAVAGEIIGAEQMTDRAALVAEGLRVLNRYDAEPHIGLRSFLVMAVARIEPEGFIDVWFIDRFGEPRCLTPETTDQEARLRNAEWEAILKPLREASGS